MILRDGDLLFSRSGTLGRALLYSRDQNGEATFAGFLVRFRLREGIDPRALHYWSESGLFAARVASEAVQSTISNFNADRYANLTVPKRVVDHSAAIADYLDAETSAMDDLRRMKRRLVGLVQERIDSAIMELVGRSVLVRPDGPLSALPLHRKLAKLDRPPESDAPMITAFRDGQVTARALRRSEGFTDAWTDGARLQGVRDGDIVVHGLDGFAGAIGTAEANGVCSPVYHVCAPLDGGDAHFYSRLLRLLATTGYLGNFATSTRERAVDFRNWDLFGSIPLPVVDVGMQRQIGALIRQLAPIRQLVAQSEMLIAERREALITAVVTGEIDVRGSAA